MSSFIEDSFKLSDRSTSCVLPYQENRRHALEPIYSLFQKSLTKTSSSCMKVLFFALKFLGSWKSTNEPTLKKYAPSDMFLLPIELHMKIVHQVNKLGGLKQLGALACTSREFNRLVLEYLKPITRITPFYNPTSFSELYKFINHSEYFSQVFSHLSLMRRTYDQAGAALLDALSTGRLNSSFSSYNKKIEKDIYQLIKWMPAIVNYGNGYDSSLTPLKAACQNHLIPLKIIKFLLEKGASLHNYLDEEDDIRSFIKNEIKPSHRARYLELKTISQLIKRDAT